MKLTDFTILINDKKPSANDLKDIQLGRFLVVSRTLLKDVGYGSGFPAYKFLFQIEIKKGDVVSFRFENMAYSPAECTVNGIEVKPAMETKVPKLGI